MKTSTLLKTLIACSLLGGSVIANAAVIKPIGKGNLEVIGQVEVPSCQLDWTAGNQADFGKVAPPDIDTLTNIGIKNLDFAVQCTAKTRIVLSFKDLKPNTLSPYAKQQFGTEGGFGLGDAGVANKYIGGFLVGLDNTSGTFTIDGDSAGITATPNSGTSWHHYDKKFVAQYPGWYIGFYKTTGASSTEPPSLGKVFKGKFMVNAFLDQQANFPTGTSPTLAGDAEITINYL